ncbi:MAG: 23S rRNA (pseudouridine(1915)-N(3))-methyltransferase RlmH [Bacteroidetes bacterium]|nr:23S rRNA (pseudouridine(1915)-N(3))-methyltransferase RlmH [Bacteroidota bacterium]
MQIVFCVIGKTNLSGVQPLVEEYSKRLNRFCKFESVVISDVKNAKSLSKELLIEKEGELFLEFIKNEDYVVLLDERGKEFPSVDFANKLQAWINNVRGRIVFLVGGAYGFSGKVYDRKDFSLSLSKMTFNHQMVRAIFCEQLYRAFSILKGLPYHHE